MSDTSGRFHLIKLVGLVPAQICNLIELASKRLDDSAVGYPQADDGRASGRYVDVVMSGSLGPSAVRVNGVQPACHQVIVDRVLDVTRCVLRAKDALVVGVIFGE